MGESQRRALSVKLSHLRTLRDQELGIVDDEAGSGSNPLGRGDGPVVVVDAKAGEKLDAAAVALVDEDL